MRSTLVLLAFALVGWGACGATMGIGRRLLPMEQALLVHALLAPVIFAGLGYLYARHFATTTPARTALAMLAVVILMDAGLVAPFFERSWAMFSSPIGTWIPFGLIFLAAWGAGRWVMGPGPGLKARAEKSRPTHT